MSGLTPELATIAKVHTSNCCVCGRKLADTKSQELGIGPVCRKRYLSEPDVVLPEEGWEKALGVMIGCGLPMHIISGALAHKPDTRKATNLIVFWASAHHMQKDVVLACSKVIRFLGFTTMADRLESDRADIRFEDDGDSVNIFTKRHDGFSRGLRRLGARMVRHSATNRFKCWAIPATDKNKLVVLAGVYFGGLQCFANGGIYTIDPKTWADFDALFPRKAVSTPAPSQYPITLSVQNSKLVLDTPYDAAFVAALRQVRGRRYVGGSLNSFPLARRQQVSALIQQHFGVAV